MQLYRFQIIQNDNIRLQTRRNGAQTMMQSVVPRRVDGRHADCVNRGHAAGNRLAHAVIDVTLRVNILYVLVIRAEGKAIQRQSVCENPAHNRFQIARRTALTHMNVHAEPPFFLHLFIAGALVIVRNSRQNIGVQIVSAQPRCMTVLRLSVKQGKLLRHPRRSIDGRYIVHDLAESQNARMIQITAHFLRIKGAAVVLKRQRRHAGRHHNKHICRNIFGFIQKIINPRRTADICRLVRIDNIGCRPAAHCLLDQLRGCNHSRFHMDMSVNQAGAEIFSRQVNFLFPHIAVSDSHNDALRDRNIRF